MRVIGGKYRGLNLASFKGEDIRPTADRVKESLFNILGPFVCGRRALDLFCGSGSLGIECLSRGSAHVVFNDVSKSSLAVLAKNLAKLREPPSAYSVTNMDFSECLKRVKEPFDIIFLDPPYRLEAGRQALEIISARGLVSDGGVAVLERDRAFVGQTEGLELCDERKYGRTYLGFFRKRQDIS